MKDFILGYWYVTIPIIVFAMWGIVDILDRFYWWVRRNFIVKGWWW